MLTGSVSHYEVLEKLGCGGMGEVYKARDLRLDRLVALKFPLPDSLGSREARARFMREARALSALNHPHIATIHEVDEADGRPFLAIEYLPGGTLRARIADSTTAGRAVDPRDLIRWGADLAEALAHAHRHGVIHRDVKSGNVLFDGEGRPKLTDFRLAKLLAAPDLSSSGVVAGTVAYMSPEQLSGKPADHRSDLFSLGVVLYEATTGGLPFSGDSVGAVAAGILHAKPPRLSQVRPGLPQGFEAVVLRLLEKSPENRYQRAEDVARDLGALLSSGRSVHPWAASTVRMRLPWRARMTRRRWAIAAAVAIVAAAAAGPLRQGLRWTRLPRQKHIAVLPVRIIGGNTDQEAFCDGLTEMLTSALTQDGTLSVVPATDARRLESAEQARREFGVNLVIHSSLQPRGDQVRLLVSLIDAERNRQIEAATIEGLPDRLYQLEDGLLAKVADFIDVAFDRPASSVLAGGAPPVQPAYDAYMRGRGFLYRYDKAGNYDRALQQFEEAVRNDPKFTLAFVGQAETNLALYRARKEPRFLEASSAAARRALELNPKLASAHVVLGGVLTESRKPAEAARELETALKLDRRDPAVYRELASVYRSQRRYAEAEEVYKKAIAARPGDWPSFLNLASFYYGQQRYLDAEGIYRRIIELTPDNQIAYRNLGVTLVSLGRRPEAERMLRHAISLRPTASAYSNLGTLYMFEQRYFEAAPALEQAAVLAPVERPNEYRIWGNLGDAYQLAGAHDDKALQAYRQAVEIAGRQLTGTPGDATHLCFLAKYRAKLGEASTAIEEVEAALTYSPNDAAVRYQAGIVYALLGNNDRALEELTAAVGRGYSLEEIQRAPELSPLRPDPRYKSLVTGARKP